MDRYVNDNRESSQRLGTIEIIVLIN